MGTRRLAWTLLSAAAVAAASVLAPAMGGAAERRACEPDASRDAAGAPSADPPAIDPATAPAAIADDGAVTNALAVRVPEGRVYLDLDRIVVPVTPGEHHELAPVLLADLREDLPGWHLSATLVDLLVDGEPVAGTVTIWPRHARPIAGERRGVERHGPSTIAVGDCVALLTAVPGAGWGSYREAPVIEADLPEETPADRVEVVLQLHIR